MWRSASRLAKFSGWFHPEVGQALVALVVPVEATAKLLELSGRAHNDRVLPLGIGPVEGGQDVAAPV